MQFFPIDSAVNEAANQMYAGASALANDAGNSFNNVLSSFIEEGREDYSGRPSGFSAYGQDSGTFSTDDANALAEELRKRNVSELAIEKLNALAVSGAPVTIGSAYGAISGLGRSTGELSEKEGETFKLLMNKLGFSKEEQEELLSMSNGGNIKGLLGRIAEKLEGLDSVDMTKQDWASLLKGLDVSGENRKGLMKLFAGAEEETKLLSGKDLEQLLSTVRGEQSAREAATQFAKTQLRGAVDATLQAAKLNERNGQVSDARGSKYADNSESLMHNSLRDKIGMDDIAQGEASLSGEGGEEHAMSDPKARAERILAKASDKTTNNFEAAISEKSKESKADSLLSKISVAPSSTQADPMNAPQAQNLNSTGKSVRQEIFSQVEQGILRNAQNGSQTLTLQLNPGNLGQVTVALTLHQGELKATLRADNQEAATALQEQVAELKASLEAEGIKVKDLDVQMGMNDEAGTNWDGHQGHNMMRDAEERTRALRLTQLRREAGESANPGRMESQTTKTDHAGLHLVA